MHSWRSHTPSQDAAPKDSDVQYQISAPGGLSRILLLGFWYLVCGICAVLGICFAQCGFCFPPFLAKGWAFGIWFLVFDFCPQPFFQIPRQGGRNLVFAFGVMGFGPRCLSTFLWRRRRNLVSGFCSLTFALGFWLLSLARE